MNEKQIFYQDVQQAMEIKAADPERIVLISIEKNPDDLYNFWENEKTKATLTEKFIVVRLNELTDGDAITQFNQLFVIRSIPSLYVFGSYAAGVSFAWPDKFPTVEEFYQYFHEEEVPIVNPEFADLSRPTAPVFNPELLAPILTTLSTMQGIAQTTQAAPEINNPRPPLAIPIPSASEMPEFPHTRPNLPPPRTRRKTKISVQSPDKTLVHEFEPDETVGDLRNWIESEFGYFRHSFITHSHNPIPDDNSLTLTQADLVPSALIRIDECASNSQHGHQLRNDEQILPDLERELVRPENQTEYVTWRTRINRVISAIFSIFNPFPDTIEVEDFFFEKH